LDPAEVVAVDPVLLQTHATAERQVDMARLVARREQTAPRQVHLHRDILLSFTRLLLVAV
jgi:hypothetical protein